MMFRILVLLNYENGRRERRRLISSFAVLRGNEMVMRLLFIPQVLKVFERLKFILKTVSILFVIMFLFNLMDDRASR